MFERFQFDELYVVSDLHLGGEKSGGRDFQIFDQGAELAGFLGRITQLQGRVGLVINGDMVDFLAEDNPRYLDPLGAEAKLERIARDASFAPVWDGLRKFAATEDRTLAITLGNHDLELALPWVREKLLDLIAGDDAAARGRVVLALDGSGFRCQVGRARVLCVHGNEVDSWNLTDHERLRRVGCAVMQGNPAPAWEPNAGTKLVIDVMNSLKQRWRFVDLLKPETDAAVPMLVALDWKVIGKARDAMGVARQYAADMVKKAVGWLGEEEAATAAAPTESADEALLRMLSPAARPAAQAKSELLQRARERVKNRTDPVRSLDADAGGEKLGLWDVVEVATGLARNKPRDEAAREALQNLRKDQTFQLDDADATFRALDKLVGSDVDILLAGHTHLERALKRRQGLYYNTGTWVGLMKLSPDQLDDRSKFADVFQAIEAGTKEALAERGLVFTTNTAAAIRQQGGRVVARLEHYPTAASPGAVVPGSEFTL